MKKIDWRILIIPDRTRTVFNTFSIGVYEIIENPSGKGAKRGATIVRINGNANNTEEVYSKAKEICEQLRNGNDYVGPKTVKL